jgi:hypothetical protein
MAKFFMNSEKRADTTDGKTIWECDKLSHPKNKTPRMANMRGDQQQWRGDYPARFGIKPLFFCTH